jgi:predicted dehydrogenase
VLSTSLVASGLNWGADVISPYAYLLDRRNGATMLSIPFGHAVDALCWTLGEFDSLNATMAVRRSTVHVTDAGTMIESDVADQVAVTGALAGGATASIHFRGGLSRGTNFLWEINGTDGDLLISGDAGHIQMLPIGLRGSRGSQVDLLTMAPPADSDKDLHLGEGVHANVARAYARLARDWADSVQTLPTFNDAVVRHRMLEAIGRAAETGQRQSYERELRRGDTERRWPAQLS